MTVIDRTIFGHRRFHVCAAIAVAYLAAAQLGFSFAFEVKQVTAVWPPSGLALAAVVLLGAEIWPGLFIGAFICNSIIGVPVIAAMAIAAGNTVAPVLAGLILRDKFVLSPKLSRLSDVLSLSLVGAVTMAISATNGTLQLLMTGIIEKDNALPVWTVWWVGDAMGVILIAPLLLTWTASLEKPRLSTDRVIELMASIVCVSVVSYLCFTSVFPLAYPVFPIVVWIALRFEQRHIALSVVLASAMALWQTTHGNGPFAAGAADYQIGMLVTFMAVLSITSLALGAMASERTAALSALRKTNEALEERVEERTSELAAANADLRLSEEQFRGAFETSGHGMAIVSTEGRWLKVNHAICEMLGYPECELLARDFQSITYKEDLETDIAHVKVLLAGVESSYQIEKRYIHKSGRLIWGLLSVSIVRDLRGQPMHFVSQIIDITDQKDATAQLLEAKEQADAANKAKNMFVANMSHELRTPMTGLMGFADLLLDDRSSERDRRHVTLMKQAFTSLLAIIDDVLDLSKMDAGRVAFESQPLRLRDLVAGLVQIFRSDASSRNITIEDHIAADVPELVRGDEKRIRQVLGNLLSNACKFTTEGRVDVTVRKIGGDRMRFAVSDTGTGIPEDKTHLLFHDFSRLPGTDVHGSGLGLAISKKLVEGMGGSIAFESVPGHGSIFYFDIPCSTSSADPSAKLDHSVRLDGIRILLAEDVEMNQIIVRSMLEAAGCAVDVASDGYQVLAALDRSSFDLVLMDVQMPKMCGLECCRRIRVSSTVYANIPIIALSANAMAGEIRDCLDAGMNDHIAKPISRSMMIEKIKRHASHCVAEPAEHALLDFNSEAPIGRKHLA